MFVRGAHAPHFYYLQLKYQFNTIKVMGRIFTAFLFIIIPFVKLFADTDASACDINSACSCFTDSSTCSSAPGCYYVSNPNDEFASGECKACDPGDDSTAGRYGSGCESSCDSITDSSNSNSSVTDFRFGHQHTINNAANARGARTMYECYKRLDGNSSAGTGHGPRCKDENDTYIEYNENGLQCRQYYRDDGKSYVSCNGTTTGTDSATGNVTDTDSDGDGYHMEGAQCYKNERKCRLFSSNCSVSSESHQEQTDDSQQGIVQWGDYIDPIDHETKHKWKYETSNCKCEIAGDLTEKSCNGTKYNLIKSMSNAETVSASISYSNPNNPDDSTVWAHYTCTGCLAGFYANRNTGGSFNCVAAPQGDYSTGCGTVWISVDNPTGSSTRDCTLYSGILKPCYAGMTTSDSGADSVQDCHYTDQTQFCDAWGCTSYSDLVGSNADNWWWYMQSGTTTGGSVNTSIDDIINDPSLYY